MSVHAALLSRGQTSAAAIFKEWCPYTVAWAPNAPHSAGCRQSQCRGHWELGAKVFQQLAFLKRRGPLDIVPRSPQSVCDEVPPKLFSDLS